MGLSRPEKVLARQLYTGLREGYANPNMPNTAPVLEMGQTGLGVIKGVELYQNETKNIANVRTAVFEQKFLQRILVNILNETSRAGEIDVEQYKRKLDTAVSEQEAILYYDELIALTHMLILYGIIVKLSESQLKMLEEKFPAHLSYVDGLTVSIDEKQKKAFGLTLKMMEASTGIGLLLGSIAVGFATGGASTALQAIALGIAAVVLLVTPAVAQGSTNTSVVPFHIRIVLKRILTILREDRQFLFSQVKDKIKYWGMTQAQADLISTTPMDTISNTNNSSIINYNNKFVKFMVSYLEASSDETPAPNKPFPEAVKKVELRINTVKSNKYTPNPNRNESNAKFLNEYRINRMSRAQNRLLNEVYKMGPDDENTAPKGGRRSRTLRRRRTMRRRRSTSRR